MANDDDDDILIPRRLHSTANCRDSNGNPAGFAIDPAMLERRRKRKQAIPPQASDSSVNEAPWQYIDRALAGRIPAFNELMWTLGDVARWVVERTPEAVDGLSIDEEKLPDALTEVHNALVMGQIAAWSATTQEPVPRELPAATWSIFEFAYEEKNGLIYTLTFRPSGSIDERPLKDLRFRSVEVRRLWPGAEPAPPPPTTVAAQTECRRWLASEMRASLDRPRPKSQVFAEAKKRFPKLSKRGFDRAWGDAIGETGAEKWSKAGQRTA
jgi:hypothetical protein